MSNLPIERQPLSDTSRLSRVGIEKFLNSDERIIHVSNHKFMYGRKQPRYAYVTNKRVLFYDKHGLLFKSDRLDEKYLNEIRGLRLVEKGLVKKTMWLQLDDMQIKGERGEVLNLYRAIQSARTQPVQTVQVNPPTQTATIKEREVIHEIVKIRCGHCGNLYNERENKCQNCGAG